MASDARYIVPDSNLKIPPHPNGFSIYPKEYMNAGKQASPARDSWHMIFPTPASDKFAPVEGLDCFYSKTFLASVQGPQWGPGEGPAEWLELEQEVLWQSRTQFADCEQDWQTYPDDKQRIIEAARMAGKKTVDITFAATRADALQSHAGDAFEIDFDKKKQFNKQDRERVRDVRRCSMAKPQWYAIKQIDVDSDPVPYDASANAQIVSGVAEGRCKIKGNLCLQVVSSGKDVFVDTISSRQYTESSGGPSRKLLQVPQKIAKVLGDVARTGKPFYGEVPGGSCLFRRVRAHFDATKFGMRANSGNVALHWDLHVERLTYVIQPKLVLQFFQKISEFGSTARIAIVFHGTNVKNFDNIMNNNFSVSKIGAANDDGWFGKGVYFGRRAYTALGYNTSDGRPNKELLCCLVVLNKTFTVPLPDFSNNVYAGKPCEAGYDAHVSPTGKELVIFNPRQILPCFKIHMNSTDYDTMGYNDYYLGVF